MLENIGHAPEPNERPEYAYIILRAPNFMAIFSEVVKTFKTELKSLGNDEVNGVSESNALILLARIDWV